MMKTPLTKREIYRASALSLAILALTSLPYLLGYALAPPDMEFSGLVMNVEDSHSYLAKMLQGAQGRWLYQIPFTTEEHEGAFVGGFYLFWGWVARLLGLPITWVWHLSRLLCGALFLALIYLFMAYFLPEAGQRLFAFSLAALGSGLGWALLLIVAQPFNLAIVAAVLLAYLAALWWLRKPLPLRRLWGLFPLLAIPLPLLTHYLHVFLTNPAFRSWWEQAETPSPHPIHYLLAYGLILLLAIPGMARLLSRRKERDLFLIAWAFVVFPLLYLPVNPQRRFLEGVHLPLSILATIGVYSWLLPRLEGSKVWSRLTSLPRYRADSLRRFVLVALLILTTPSNLYILASLSATALEHPYPFFRERAEVEAADWLATNTSPADRVFTTYWTGSYLPARAGNLVFLGHWAETLEYERKMEEAKTFFSPLATEEWRRRLLAQYNIDYLFYGPRERALAGFEPEKASCLERVYTNSLVTIYRVAKE